MKTFAAALMIGAATAAVTSTELKYMNHLAKYGRNIADSNEFNIRLARFNEMDSLYEASNATEKNFTLGHNHLSDWTREEYGSLLGLRHADERLGEAYHLFPENDIPSYVNWVEAGAVTAVKDQGQCGSCWSFSTTGAMEGAHFIQNGELLSFSEQQLVDCSGLNLGCNGGNPLWAYRYLKSHYAELESAYPYVSGTTRTAGDCQYDATSKTSVEVQTSASVQPDSVTQMKAALAQQPLSVLVEADTYVFQGYTQGILDSTACGTSLDHAVLAVGYGYDAELGMDYWLVKNSWNTTWGDEGYIRLAIVDGDGICGVQMGPAFPTSN